MCSHPKHRVSLCAADEQYGIVGRPRPNVLIPPKAHGAIVVNLTDYFRPLRAALGARVNAQTGVVEFYLKNTGADHVPH